MGECDQATTESILDFFYDQVRLPQPSTTKADNIPY